VNSRSWTVVSARAASGSLARRGGAIRAGVAQRMYLQQRVFDRFRHEYNTERPHEALDYRAPASAYVASPRSYPVKLRSPKYSNDREVYVVKPV
jgi:transposase InsO family protein